MLQVPALQTRPLVHPRQVAPPLPHALSSTPDSQPFVEQQPLQFEGPHGTGVIIGVPHESTSMAAAIARSDVMERPPRTVERPSLPEAGPPTRHGAERFR